MSVITDQPPNVRAFLDTIAWSEGTSTSPITQNEGYDVIVTGVNGPSVFTDYSEHPFAGGRAPVVVRQGPPQLLSTAAGRYQLLARYYHVYAFQLHVPDFSPLSQDIIALQQIREHHDAQGNALQHVIAGQIEAAIALCSGTWASLPGNGYGQGGRTIEELLEKFNEFTEAM